MTIFISFITLLIIFFGYRIYVYKRVDVGEKVNFSMTGKMSGATTNALWIIDAVVCKIKKDDYYVQYARVTQYDNTRTSFYLDAPWQAPDWNANWLGGCGIPASLGNDATTLKKVILKRNEFKKGWVYGNLMYDNTKHQPIIEKTFFGF